MKFNIFIKKIIRIIDIENSCFLVLKVDFHQENMFFYANLSFFSKRITLKYKF